MPNQEKEDKNLNDFSSKSTIYLVLIIFSCIALIGVVLFIIALKIDPKHGQWQISLGDAGTVGDLIGGTSAPIIGLFSAWLIYKSFSAQIRANEKVQLQIDRSQLEQNFLFLINEYDKLVSDSLKYEYEGNYGIIGYKNNAEKLKLLSQINKSTLINDFYTTTSKSIDIMNKNIDELQSHLTKILTRIREVELLELNENQLKMLNHRYWLFYKDYLTGMFIKLYNIKESNLNGWNYAEDHKSYSVRLGRVNNLIGKIEKLKEDRKKIKKFFGKIMLDV